jgi:hypothetical protein
MTSRMIATPTHIDDSRRLLLATVKRRRVSERLTSESLKREAEASETGIARFPTVWHFPAIQVVVATRADCSFFDDATTPEKP